MDITLAKQILQTLYADVDTYAVSAQARSRRPYHNRAFTYGEVVPESFYKILTLVHPQKDEIFYDLGSGSGKALVLAHLLFDFKKIVGVEYLPELCELSKGVISRLQHEIDSTMSPEKSTQEIEVIHADFLESDFSDADIIFTHSTCFHDELMVQLERKYITMKKGIRVITVTKNLQSPYFQLIGSGQYQMTWGASTVFCYEKIGSSMKPRRIAPKR